MKRLSRRLPSWAATIVFGAGCISAVMIATAIRNERIGMTPIAAADPICPCDYAPIRIAGADAEKAAP